MLGKLGIFGGKSFENPPFLEILRKELFRRKKITENLPRKSLFWRHRWSYYYGGVDCVTRILNVIWHLADLLSFAKFQSTPVRTDFGWNYAIESS
jgi:hypothetical protein